MSYIDQQFDGFVREPFDLYVVKVRGVQGETKWIAANREQVEQIRELLRNGQAA